MKSVSGRIFVLAFALVAHVAAPARADPACDKAGLDAATQCVQNNAGAATSSATARDEMMKTCAKAGQSATDKCENDKKRRPRLRELVLTKCDETYCYLVGVTNSEVACGRMEKTRMKIEGTNWTNIGDAELYKYDDCPKPVRDDRSNGKTGPQPAFQTRPPPVRASSDVTPPPPPPPSALDQILAPFSNELGPPKGAPPPANRNMVGPPPRSATDHGSTTKPNTPGGRSTQDQSTITGTGCTDSCTGANANTQACAQCRAQQDQSGSAKPSGDGDKPPAQQAQMPTCAKTSGQICGTKTISSGIQTFWCCAPWRCDSVTLGKCNPPN